VPPTSHPLATVAAWREDVAAASLDRGEALAQAPEADIERGLCKVPRVLA
jgi:Asp-tRNA(Asn)/Glu-tRNA(Gln) amidotransferase C subunit